MRIWHVLLLYSAVLLGCVDDAPRDNPLDPLSPKFVSRASLTGRTIIANQTTGIEGVLVSHIESGTFVITDSMGYFSFKNLPEGLNRFACSKQNFTSDTFQVQIQSGAPVNIVRALNGAPVVLSQKILTRKIDHVSSTPEYSVDIDAKVIDPNGSDDFTLSSVWFAVVDTSASDTNFYPMQNVSPDLEKFAVSLPQKEFPTNTIQWLTGKELHIVAKDRNMAAGISVPFYISRIIENASTPLSPSSSENVGLDTLAFKWKPPDVTFNYTSTVAVHQGVNETAVWTIAGLSSLQEQYPSDGSTIALDPGNYIWTVTIVDDFGNYSRSKESYFIIE